MNYVIVNLVLLMFPRISFYIRFNKTSLHFKGDTEVFLKYFLD